VIARIDGAPVSALDLDASSAEPAHSDPRRALDILVARKLLAAEARARGLAGAAGTRAKLAAVRREAAAREEEVLRDALFAALKGDAEPTDAELRAHYEATRLRYAERQFRLLRQRFGSEAAARAANTELGREGRLDPAKAEALGPAPVAGLPREIVGAALRLRTPGERGLALEPGGAASLVELVELLPAEPAPFEAVRERVAESVRTQRAQEALRAELARLRAEAKVEVDEEVLRGLSSRALASER